MDIRRLLASVQRVLPVLLRHVCAYGELAARDWETAKTVLLQRLQVALLLIVTASLALLLLCVFVIALTWDSEYRLLAIGLMAGAFVIVAIASSVALGRRQSESFEALRREWREDRALIQRLVFKDDRYEPQSAIHQAEVRY